MKNRIMYIEKKAELAGNARIGRVAYTRSGKTINYGAQSFQRSSGDGVAGNYFDTDTEEEYWISVCSKDGKDTLYSGIVDIDEDIREEYWIEIRSLPKRIHLTSFKSTGKYKR